MGSLGNPKPWVPYINTKDCSQGFCSLSCPQWCYIIFPPPPPSPFPDENSKTGLTFSPLVIAIIGILASAFLLVSYYAIISKYCGNSSDASGRRMNHHQSPSGDNHHSHNDDDDPSQHEPWLASTTGLDEALIKKITTVKYNKGDGLVGSTDCSVCLGEFIDDDTLRLLPKCSHAFHVACIDTWLKSHSNCPLCRANIVSSFSQPPPPSSANTNHIPQHHENQVRNLEEIRSSDQEEEMGVVEQENGNINLPKIPFRALSDLGRLGLRESRVIEIRDHGEIEERIMRRSISLDHSHEIQVSISDVLRFEHQGTEDMEVEDCQLHDQSSKEAAGESSSESEIGSSTNSSNSNTSVVLQCVMNSVPMKRSFSSGRFLFSKHGKGSSAVNPV